MKIALLGYGKMGKEIEKIALLRNHTISLVIDINNSRELTVENLQKSDVAIDFSTPSSAAENILKCFEAGVPIVCGTTGWMEKTDEIRNKCRAMNQALFFSSNFSIGVNIFFAVNRYLAKVMNSFEEYNVDMKEIHHIHKLDAPSGTAITLAGDIISCSNRKQKWELNAVSEGEVIGIKAEREGEVPGTHFVKWDSPVDSIEICHMAKNRKGFAFGAVLAAEFIKDKKGIYSMQDLLKL